MHTNDSNSLRVSTHATQNEALFIHQGSPLKPGKNGTPPTRVETGVDPLLQLDLRFDALKTYMEGFSTVINQHASIINRFQTDIDARLIESNLYGVIQKLGNSSALKDKGIAAILNPLHEAPRPENTGSKQDDSVNLFCNKLELFTYGFSHFNKVNTTFNEKFNKIDTQLNNKVNTDDFKGKVKRTKTKLRTKMDENYKTLDEKIKALETKVQTRVDTLDRKIDEVEKHTTWRIKDCEDLLRSRINDTYVDDALRLLEERLKQDIEKMTFGSTESLQKTLKELTQKIKQCEDHSEEKFNALKKNIKDIETNVSRRLETTKFEEFKREILARVQSESEKLLNLTRKCEPAVDRLTTDMTKVNEEIADIRSQLKSMSGDIENLLLNGNVPVVSGGGEIDKAEMEAYFAKYKLELNKMKESIKHLEEAMQTKVDSSHFTMQLTKKLDVSEFEKLLMSVQSDSERMRRLLQSSEALQSQIDKIEELIDKKFSKFKKEFDIATLLKQLKAKAEEENVAKGFENTDKKINALSESLLALKKELDHAFSSLEKMSVQMFSHSDNASLSTKKINPLNCLSCGNYSRTQNLAHTAMGIDGRLYKTDVRESMQDIFDGSSPADLRSTLGKQLIPGNERMDRTINVTYSHVQTSNNRMRPQTATIRGGKALKGVISQPASPSAVFSHRPTSAKK